MSSKQYFDTVAAEWDTMRQEFFHTNVRERALSEAQVKEHSTVADIGAGNGFINEGLIDKNVNIIALDQSQLKLDVMKEKFTGNTQIDYRQGEAENLPLRDNEVDAAFANMFLHDVESPQNTIKDIYRALKPGGIFIITDLDKHNHEFLITEQNDRWPGFERNEIKEWFREAGFKNVMIDCIGENCCSESKSTDEIAEISIFIAKEVK